MGCCGTVLRRGAGGRDSSIRVASPASRRNPNCCIVAALIHATETRTSPYAHRYHLLPHLRRLRRRRHRAWHGTRRAWPRHSFHQLCPAHPHEPQRSAHPFPRSRSRLLPALRPPPYTLALATKMLEVFESESLDLL